MERLSVYDRAELATDVGPNPRHITVLLVLGGPVPDLADVRRRMARAVDSQPRLAAVVCRRRARSPVWVPVAVDLERHVTALAAPGADPLDLAAADLARRLPDRAPLWRLTVVDLGDDARSALVWTSHHLLGNGPSLLGLLLATLGDVAGGSPWRSPGRVAPPVAALPRPSTRPGRAASSPLVRMATGGVVAASVQVDSAAVRAGAHACGATVNDALLWAWSRAYHRADVDRGGPGEHVVMSVPVTVPGRRFGNDVGAMRVAAPPDVLDDAATGLPALALRTRAAKRRIRPWTWPLAPLGVLVLARLGVLPTVLRRQRLISTVVTHAPGPAGPVHLAGARLLAAVPIVPLVGNVTTCVAALSIAGRLDAAVLCSPESADLAPSLADDLRDGLRQVADLAPRLP
ncbi:WS/DGAT domain-containing protein [Cellulomonas fimi]|uniref:WS/DGAT domain-containing protein n=1 Tax=Cellulomonas fimi TaxID=1708 RepID=UPI00234D0717|nr:WS/DGAT domain-containing protein [Cellulomonas fimi]MDC7122267.1 WS/DGAT domain-containing protein [Cellulomonas fimi]